jgi:hypothetical protein
MGTRSALIVANDSYQDPGLRKLRAPAQDARALESVLADPGIGGFDVRVLMNQSEAKLRREVAAFFADRAHDDLLLTHFSCHGVKDDSGQLYFATTDTDLTSLDATAIPAEFVNRHMTRSRSRRVVLLLDCCYSGAFARGMLARADQAVDLKERFEGRGRIVLTASSAMEYAFEEAELARAEGQPSIFTRALVRGLESGEADRDRDGRVSVNELYDYLFDEVRRLTPNQTPGRWNFEVQGDLLIARSPAVRAATLPLELQQAIEHPIVRMRLAAVEELERLLIGGHAGLALAAREALALLAEDDSARVRAAARSVLDARPRAEAIDVEPAPDQEAVSPPVVAGTVTAPPPQPNPENGLGRPEPVGIASPPPAHVPTINPSSTRTEPRRPRRRRGLLPLLVAIPLLAALILWVGLSMRGPSELVPGREFSATSPWHLDVKGTDCTVTVAPIGYQGSARTARGSNVSLQIRNSGTFILKELTSGCTATRASGSGRNIALPFDLVSGSDGAGGDTRVFDSFASAEVKAEGAGCATTTVYDSATGEVADHFEGSSSAVVGKGEFYVHSDANCTVKVTPS